MPGAPLPTISSLLKALFWRRKPEVKWFDGGPDFMTRYYSHGRMALAEGIKAVMKSGRYDSATVFVPDYICNDALEILRIMPIAIIYYPIIEDLSPDWYRLKEICAREKGLKLFLLVHYFGFPNRMEEAVMFCENNNMVLIEDGAHMLKPQIHARKGPLMIFSPRKLLPLSSGGVLVIQKQFGKYLGDMKRSDTVREDVTWICSMILQKCLIKFCIPWKTLRRFREETRNHEGAPERYHSKMGLCGKFALKMLADAEDDLEETARRRRNNYSRIASRIAGLKGVRVLSPLVAEDACPYVFPLIIEEGAKLLLGLFESIGIPAAQWPCLPPEVLDTGDKHGTALWVKDHLLLLPLHQSLSLDDADVIGSTLCGSIPS